MIRFRRSFAAFLLVAATLLIACGPVADKAGGRGEEPTVTLTLAAATASGPVELTRWMQAVTDGSNGTVRLSVQPADAAQGRGWRPGQVEFETGTLDDVASGVVDAAWVGARSFDLVGVSAFQPLLAPFVVDSYVLQDAVFRAGIPQRMLDSVQRPGLVALAILPGPMRRMLGVAHPFQGPGDFAGSVVGLNDSALSARTLRALGAIPRAEPASAPLTGLDGFEQQVQAIAANHYAVQARFVTANLALWPRPLVIVMNRERFDRLSADQQRVLLSAGATALPEATVDARAEEEAGMASLCRDGVQFPMATAAQLSALQAAVRPVVEAIRHDPANAVALDAILAIKKDLPSAADVLSCPTAPTPAPADPDGVLAGTYIWTMTVTEARAKGDEDLSDYPSTFTISLAHGRWTLRQTVSDEVDGGTYQLVGDRIEFTWDTVGDVLRFSFTVDDAGNVRLVPVQPMNAGDAFIWSTHPWVRFDPTDQTSAPPTR